MTFEQRGLRPREAEKEGDENHERYMNAPNVRVPK